MKAYDLTAQIDDKLWYYGPPYIPYETEQLATIEKNGYNTAKHVLTSHCGTHIECARHWSDSGESIEQIPPEETVGPARVLKLNGAVQPLYAIGPESLISAGGEKLQPGEICIIATGWDSHLNEEDYTWKSPFLTMEGAAYLVGKGIKLIAMDTPMIGDPRDGMDFVPKGTALPDLVCLNAGVHYILGLVGAAALPEQVFFCGQPLKLAGSDGSPIRALAIEDL